MKRKIAAGFLASALAAGVCFSVSGCEGTESREQVDETVEAVVGKEQTDQFKKVKEELGAIEAQQADRYKALEEE